MTETSRTTVTLSKVSMDQVRELIGVFGSTPAAVISRIVEHFFDYGKFDDVLNRLIAKKRDLYPPDEKTIEKRINNLFKGANKIPLEEFIDYLEISKKFVFNNIHKWKEKYNIKIIENLVVQDN
ncbi:MAG: hypothetical protein ACFFFB_03385 [Candidatus Heimdallarchaeota archaeon]